MVRHHRQGSKKGTVNLKKSNDNSVKEVETFDLPIQLREDLFVTVKNLPLDLKEREAKRIGNIIELLGIKEYSSKE